MRNTKFNVDVLIQFLLFFFTSFYLLASTAGVINSNSFNHFYSWYLLFSNVALFCLCFSLVYKYNPINTPYLFDNILSRRTLIALLLLVIITIAFIITRKNGYNYSIWLDEYVQFEYGNLLRFNGHGNISDYAALEQQPPMTYYFSGLSGKIFGTSHLSVKLPTIIFSLSFFLILTTMIYSLTKNLFITFSVTLLCLFNPIMTFYSVEARGYSQALLLSLFTLFYTINSYKYPSKENWILLFISQCLFVLSIGFQPELYLIILCLNLAPFFFLNRSIYFKHLIVNVCTMVFFLPYMYHIYISSIITDKFNGSFFQKIIQTYNETPFLYHYWKYFTDNALSNYVILLSALIFIFHILNKAVNKVTLSKEENITIFLIMTVLSFPFLFTLTFKTIINWHYSPRYYIVFYPLMFITLSLVLKRIQEDFKSLFTIIVITLLMTSTSPLAIDTDFNRTYSRFYRMDWMSIYSYLEKKPKFGDKVFHLTLNDVGDWRPDVFVAKDLYSSKDTSLQYIENKDISQMDSQSQIGFYLSQRNLKGTTHFISNTSRNDLKTNLFLKSNLDLYQLKEINKMLILSFNNQLNMLTFFTRLHLQFKHESWSLLVTEILLTYSIDAKDKDMAKQYLNDIKNLKLNKDKTIEDSIIDKEKIRNNLVSYYSNLIGEMK